MTFQAMIRDDFPLRQVVIELGRTRPDDMFEVLMADGTWTLHSAGLVADGPSGIRVPYEAVDAIAAAIRQWKGGAVDGATEAKVLREWLAVEQRRVDDLIAVHADLGSTQ